uniref:VWFC domain-containing protein n=1 Tax=Octopus bimaculoides TaxID=37653 RepID=A0A0L8G8C6_OCTBM
MTSFLLKTIVLAVLVQLAFGATFMMPECPDGVANGSYFLLEGMCAACWCQAPAASAGMTAPQPMASCVSCAVVNMGCGETELVNPNATYPACCEERCKNN